MSCAAVREWQLSVGGTAAATTIFYDMRYTIYYEMLRYGSPAQIRRHQRSGCRLSASCRAGPVAEAGCCGGGSGAGGVPGASHTAGGSLGGPGSLGGGSLGGPGGLGGGSAAMWATQVTARWLGSCSRDHFGGHFRDTSAVFNSQS